MDESLFDYVGWVCTQSGVPFRDAADHDFPGMFFLHALARFLFNSPMWSFRSFDYLLLLAFCGLVYHGISKTHDKLTALIFVPLYQTMYVTAGFWISGQRDLIGTHFAIAAGLMFLERVRGGGVAWLCGAAFLVWSAMLVKPTFGIYVPAFLLIDLAMRGRSNRGLPAIFRDQAIAASVVVGLTAVLLACAWASDSLEKGLDLAVRFNSEVYGRKRTGLYEIFSHTMMGIVHDWHWYLAFSAVGLYLWWKRGDRLTLLLLLYCLGATISLLILQGKGFFYHMSGALPIFGLLAANCMAWLGRSFVTLRPGDPRKVVVALAALLAFYGLGSKLYRQFNLQCLWHMGKLTTYEYFDGYDLGDLMKMADYVGLHSKPTETVWSYNTGIIVNVVAARRLPVRFAHPLIIQNAVPPFSRAGQWKEEIDTVLRDHPPKLVVLARSASGTGYQFLENLKEGSASQSLKDAVGSRYRLVYTAGVYDCFELKE